MLTRKWDADREYIKSLCRTFKANTVYRRVTPWCWFSFVEGTRFDASKLRSAQEFARSRGFPVLQHLLQPRVKGFSYLVHHMLEVLGTINDITILYRPNAPSFTDFLVRTRLCRYAHLHLRVFRKNELPRAESDADLSVLDQWLRDRWTEKDEIMRRMKAKEISYRVLERSPWSASRCYAVCAALTVHCVFGVGIGCEASTQAMVMTMALFPVAIVYAERMKSVTF